jgi:phosphoenolpyruvate synthase/pyruvate phosphate dikinase
MTETGRQVFASKAKTLENIHNKLSMAKTLPVFMFYAKDYFVDTNLLRNIQNFFCCETVAVRSSAKNEDSYKASNAGVYKSVLNVCLHDVSQIEKAIKTVLDSYDDNNGENEVFIQPMLRNVKLAGVAFSCDISTLAPYYVINWDESGQTDAITNGSVNSGKTYIQYKHCSHRCNNQDINNVIKAVAELEMLFDNRFIDVKFAVTHDADVYILQARPVITVGKSPPYLDLTEGLYKVYKKLKTSAASPKSFR